MQRRIVSGSNFQVPSSKFQVQGSKLKGSKFQVFILKKLVILPAEQRSRA